MGKTSDKVSRLDKVKSAIKSSGLSKKPVKSGNAIKKESAKIQAPPKVAEDHSMTIAKKKSRPSSKKRRFL
jgi:hypothetical protein